MTHTEQRVVAWDRINPRTGQLEEARLDFATRDALTGRSVFADVTVTCAYSGYEPCQRARARKDGLAAVNAVAKKRDRYPPSGGELIPLAWEDGGRPAEETVTYVRSWGHGFPGGALHGHSVRLATAKLLAASGQCRNDHERCGVLALWGSGPRWL